MCNRIDHNSGVSNPSSGSAPSGPKPSGDLGTARVRCFQPKPVQAPAAPQGGPNTDPAQRVQNQILGIFDGLMQPKPA